MYRLNVVIIGHWLFKKLAKSRTFPTTLISFLRTRLERRQ